MNRKNCAKRRKTQRHKMQTQTRKVLHVNVNPALDDTMMYIHKKALCLCVLCTHVARLLQVQIWFAQTESMQINSDMAGISKVHGVLSRSVNPPVIFLMT